MLVYLSRFYVEQILPTTSKKYQYVIILTATLAKILEHISTA